MLIGAGSGEAGTLAIGHPNISTQVRIRKGEELKLSTGRLQAYGYEGRVKVLTSCPSCIQGLLRYKDDIEGVGADYIVVEIAKHVLGDNWMREYVDTANKGGIERVLV